MPRWRIQAAFSNASCGRRFNHRRSRTSHSGQYSRPGQLAGIRTCLDYSRREFFRIRNGRRLQRRADAANQRALCCTLAEALHDQHNEALIKTWTRVALTGEFGESRRVNEEFDRKTISANCLEANCSLALYNSEVLVTKSF